jgi:hypothetical protein
VISAIFSRFSQQRSLPTLKKNSRVIATNLTATTATDAATATGSETAA